MSAEEKPPIVVYLDPPPSAERECRHRWAWADRTDGSARQICGYCGAAR